MGEGENIQNRSATNLAQAVVVFSIDHQRYGIALPGVRRSIRVVAITPLPKAPVIVLGIVDLGGVLVPVIDIRKRFHHAPRPLCLSDHLLIATAGKRTVALLVDETMGVIEVLPASYATVGDNVPKLDLIDGAIKLEDGLVLIHNLERLLSLDEDDAIAEALNSVAGNLPLVAGPDDGTKHDKKGA